MYNKRWLLLVSSLVLLLSLLSACIAEEITPTPTPTPRLPETKLKFATWLALGHPNAAASYEYWARLVTERTNGAVTFEWYPLQQLIKGPEMLAGVGAGVADLGIVVPSYEAGRIPLHLVEGLPFAYTTPDQVAEVFQRGSEILNAELAAFNVRMISYNVAQFYVLYTTNKPVKTVDDLKGLRIRSPGGMADKILEKAGAVPVTMSSADVFTAMQRGMLDGMTMLPTSPEGHPWSELVKYVIMTNHMMVAGSTIINLNTWNRLPPELQKIMLDAARDMDEYNRANLAAMTEQALKASQERGMQIIVMDELERTKWKELCAPLWDEWISTCEKAGKGDAAQQLLQIVKEVTK